MPTEEVRERGPTKQAALETAFESLTGKDFDSAIEYVNIGDDDLNEFVEDSDDIRHNVIVTYETDEDDEPFPLNGTLSQKPGEDDWEAHLYY